MWGREQRCEVWGKEQTCGEGQKCGVWVLDVATSLWAYFSGRFTSKPKRGVKFLQEKGLIGKTSEEVARFFHSDVRLDRTAVGDYLGEGDE